MLPEKLDAVMEAQRGMQKYTLLELGLKIQYDQAAFIERHLAVMLNQRPRWMPGRTWRWMITKVLRVEWRE